jgi:hypothetical protein
MPVFYLAWFLILAITGVGDATSFAYAPLEVRAAAGANAPHY